MKVSVITVFPEMFSAITDYGVVGRAYKKGILDVNLLDLRDFSEDKNGRVDDRPYGGGPGMVMHPGALTKAIIKAKEGLNKPKVVYVSPQGRKVSQQDITDLVGGDYVFIAGRYEGIDERVIDSCVDIELSIGDYVLSGGELAVMVLLDAMARWLPGTLGHEGSAEEDSFAKDGLLDCPHYTRPDVFEGMHVPKVLLSGDHAEISRWRRMQKLGRTWQRRRDLIDLESLSEEDRFLLKEYLKAGENQ